jgi:phosphonate transport system substrate-binding protein
MDGRFLTGGRVMANMEKSVDGAAPLLVISYSIKTPPVAVVDHLDRFFRIPLVVISLIAAVAMLLPHMAFAQNEKELLFGVVPQQAASRLAKMWDPFITRLSEETGLNIKFATMKDIPSFEECLSQGAYDIAYMNPYHYIYYSEQAGYRAFAHQLNKKLQGIIVTRADSSAGALKDLTGKQIAFPSPAAFGASVLPRAEMKAQGVDFEPVYVKSHDSVYRSVEAGFYLAGGGVKRTFNAVPGEIRSKLRIIYETKGYTPHAYAAKKSLSPETVKVILNGMMAIAEKAPELLKPIGMKGFQAATDSEWGDVRNLKLTRFQTEIVQHGELKCRFD